MRRLAAALTLGAALSLPMEEGKGGCTLDQAQVIAVPPDTFQVMASYLCGEIRCWERSTHTGGQRIGLGRACEGGNGDDKQKLVTPDS